MTANICGHCRRSVTGNMKTRCLDAIGYAPRLGPIAVSSLPVRLYAECTHAVDADNFRQFSIILAIFIGMGLLTVALI
jgi:hypothetical protein